MQKVFRTPKIWMTVLCICTILLLPSPVFANTNGQELQVTDQPDKLIIQLGPAWAGVDFKLETDIGLYPQPILVSTEGILEMELGGSKTYTLSAFHSEEPVPEPLIEIEAEVASESVPGQIESEPIEETNAIQSSDLPETSLQETIPDHSTQIVEEETDKNLVKGIPNAHLFIFSGGTVVCVAGLIFMHILKRKTRNRLEDDDYDEDE